MRERRIRPLKPHLNPQKAPQLLDIIRFEGRWAQMHTNPKPEGTTVLRYLDTGELLEVRFSDYLGLRYDISTGKIGFHEESRPKEPSKPTVLQIRDNFSEAEIENIHWGAGDHERHPHLKLEVSVWGELRKMTGESEPAK